MAFPLKATNEQVVAAYRKYGSVWKAAKSLGMGGQSLWERLKAIGYQMGSSNWTIEEIDELKSLAPECTIGDIARRLGRPYAGVAGKISELGLGVRYGNSTRYSIKRGSGMTKTATAVYLRDLKVFGGSLRQFCLQRGLSIELLAKGIQTHHVEGWKEYVRLHSDLQMKRCPQCTQEFIPMNSRQLTCSRRCGSLRRTDVKYFGGRRSNAIGLEEGICQLCEKEKARLAAHHVYGKENDQENEFLIALCPGCHGLVGNLGVRNDVTSKAFWENLMALALARKHGARKPAGFHICVDIDELTEQDIQDELGTDALNTPGAVILIERGDCV